MPRRSIRYPLALGITLMVLALALGIAWQVIIVGGWRPSESGLTAAHWVAIALGSLVALTIFVGLLLLCIWLVREIRSNQRQQAFIDAVTHEMKTPLAALRLYLDTLERHDPAPERRRAFLARMQEDVARLERTVMHVLAAARSEERVRLRPGDPVDLTAIIRSAADDVRRAHALPEESIAIARKRPLTALGDAAELAVVFRNLIENAVKYSRPPLEVRVALQEMPDGRVRAEIADRGIGIEPRELRRIFGRFYQVGRDAAGLGLGLFIVRSLVRRNGGDVEARSEGLGRGSRFTVTLRAAPGAHDAAPRDASQPASPASAAESH
jgi:two-component system, OmpR family, phosphate regulon sensor histidine kinase PhoR